MAVQTDKKNGIRFIPECELSKLSPYIRNPRKNDQAIEAVAKSIERFGKIAPIIVDEKMQICAGHTRFKAALERGEKTFPVIVAPQLTGDRFKAYNIADNQTASIAEWDTPELAAIIKELEQVDIDALGFDSDELSEILASIEGGQDGLTDPDDVPESPKKAISRTGDLWLCGDHKLLCGDATKAEDVERLLNGAKPVLMVTDPPYGVEYDAQWRQDAAKAGHLAKARRAVGKVTADTPQSWKAAYELFTGVVAYVWHASASAVQFAIDLMSCGFDIRNQIIWSKPTFAISRGHYHWQHEPCWYCVRKGQQSKWIGDHSQSTIWEISNRQAEHTDHSTQKPFECMARPIRNHDAPEVYDPFLGSGTTMIAAEQLKRKCYAMEICETYVDVSVRRWQNHTGKQAQLIRNGKPSKITIPIDKEKVKV